MSYTATLQSEIDRCVMCGMCSQFCPTYAITMDENESPRGRIALISALEKGQLAVNNKLVAHLEHCTYCRACENYCPSGVRFSAIMDKAKANIAKQHTDTRYELHMRNILANPEKTRRLGRWLERYQRWGLQRLMRASGLLSLIKFEQGEKLLPHIPDIPAQPEYSPAINAHHGDVALFTGCVSSILDQQALDASRRLLNVLGYGVYTPAGQSCCGAIHQHSGHLEQAEQLARENMAVFNELDVDVILHTSSGCTSFLKEYDQLPITDYKQNNDTKAFTGKVRDINQFLTSINWPDNIRLKSFPKHVAVHEPCSARNVLHQADKTYRLLENIPGIELVPLPGNEQCCGAGGSQLLAPTKFSNTLRQNKLDALSGLNTHENEGLREARGFSVDTLVTTNIGCALHLASGLREKGIQVEVLHPVTLLMRQIDYSHACTSAQTFDKVMT